ncbi:type IV pilus biosynthesis protein [Acetobacter malorum DSM 14337]|uniref:Type IV pilus biosynthesis protein n=1 Tax=Acetobacter malorum DSM 14337 TaxID=1307910 RepID=A0ABQ0PZC1_9PROT|nr:type II secretion system F family protein [Acetobacter malorum]KXV05641.1 hypothetical protein AD930_10905 [Acetobacter malorum]GBQ85344.1 type IV pilus biosynthesis protein [Acetobacter malorum DSM 14337]
MSFSDILALAGIDPQRLLLQVNKLRFTATNRIKMYDMLENLADQGDSISDALKLIYEVASEDGKKPNALLAYIARDWRDKVEKTIPLSDAVAEWVPARERMAIAASGKTGQIAQSLRDVIFVMDGEIQIKTAIKEAAKEPIISVIMSLGLYYVFSSRVIPQFALILPPDKWSGVPYAALWMSQNLIATLVPIISVVIGGIIAIAYSIPRWTGRTRVFFDRLPPWSVYRILMGGSFLLTISSLRRSGMPEKQILQMMTKGASPWLIERLLATRHILGSGGKTMGDALYETGLEFPSKETTIILRAYSKNPSTFDKKLEIVGRKWLISGVGRTKQIIATVNVITQIMFYGVLVFFGSALSLLEMQLAGK